MLGDHADASVPMSRIIAHELEIYGSHGMQAWRYDAMLAMIEAGRLRPEALIGAKVTLSDAIEALNTMDRFPDGGIKIIERFE